MEYWTLPPEINSARLYAGPGSAPLLTAAQAWGALSHQLYGTASAHTAAIGALATTWTGPAAEAMSRAALTYRAWLLATAAQADTTAAQAHAAAAAFETARATIVHPALIAANRAQLAALVATNWLGQNTAAIAATEAAYAEMWAQDAAAMYGYQAASAQAATLPTFTLPPTLTTPPPGTQAILNQLADPTTPLGLLNQYAIANLSSGPWQLPTEMLALFTVLWGVSGGAGALSALANPVTNVTTPTTPPAAAAVKPALPPVRAATGVAQRPGALSVPPSWTQRAPLGPELPPTARPTTPGETEIPIPLPTPLPISRDGTPSKQQRPQPEYGARVRFVPRPPAGG